MNQVLTRDAVLESLKGLPETVTLDEIIEHLVLKVKIEDGLQRSDARELIPHEAVMARFLK
jgi:hypothetical protein